MKQNITLSMERDVLKRVRVHAAAEGKSVSALMADHLEQIVEDSETYRQAMAAALEQMNEGLDLGSAGIGKREAGHDRKSLR